MSRLFTSLAGAAILIVTSGSAIPAQDGGRLSDLKACRLDASQISLRFSFEGGACIATEPARVEQGTSDIAKVVVPTRSTAEVCTMQVVPVTFSDTLDIDASIAALDISVLTPEGQSQASGQTAILPPEDCAAGNDPAR